MRSKCCLQYHIPLAASSNIKRKVSEATAEVRSDVQLDHVLFHQCKRVADWLRFKSSYIRLADWLVVESSDTKNRDSCYIMNAVYAIAPAAIRIEKILPGFYPRIRISHNLPFFHQFCNHPIYSDAIHYHSFIK